MPLNDALETASRLDAVLDATVDGIVTIDAAGEIESFNKACEKMFGYQASEVIGKNVSLLMPQPYRNEHEAYLRRYQETGTAQIIGIGREVQGQRADGSLFPVDLAVSEVQLADRIIYTGIIRDITTRKVAEESLQAANRELEEFAYRTSHDLRAPLSSTLGLLKVVQTALDNNNLELAEMSVVKAIESVESLETLVEDLMSLAKVRHLDEEPEPVYLEDLVQAALQKYKDMDHFERLNIDIDLNVLTLVCKRHRLQTIVENLISNAVKYQDLDKADPRILIATRQEADHFILEVRDNGLGIPADQESRLFSMFARFHPRVSFGSGLGLYKIKQCARDMGGEIEYEAPGEGAIFRLRLLRS